MLPIAFSLLHFVRSEDNATSCYILGSTTLWEEGGWTAKIEPTVENVGRGTPMDVAEQLRFQSIDAWRSYQGAVFAHTEAALEDLPLERYTETPLCPELPPAMARAFVSYVVAPGQPPPLLDAIECFIYQHGIRHLGELEHARALVGLSGTS